jgi:hypothetical protein
MANNIRIPEKFNHRLHREPQISPGCRLHGTAGADWPRTGLENAGIRRQQPGYRRMFSCAKLGLKSEAQHFKMHGFALISTKLDAVRQEVLTR